MNVNPDDARVRLALLAKQLAELSFPTSPISTNDAHWLAECLDTYLAGKHKSLDAALGLNRPRGGQIQTQKRELIAQTWASSPEITWDKLAELVCKEYPAIFVNAPDEKEMRRAIGRKKLKHLTQLATKALGVEIATKLKGR